MDATEGGSYLTGEHLNLHICLKTNLSVCLKWLRNTCTLWPSNCWSRNLSQGCRDVGVLSAPSGMGPAPPHRPAILSSPSQSYRLTQDIGDNTAQSCKSLSPVARGGLSLWLGRVLKAHPQPEEGASSLEGEGKKLWPEAQRAVSLGSESGGGNETILN